VQGQVPDGTPEGDSDQVDHRWHIQPTGYGRSLGLKRIGDVVIKEDRPEIRGMVATVQHLVKVEEVE